MKTTKTTKTTTTKTIRKDVTKAGFDKFNKMEGLRDILKEQGFKEKAPINFESKKYPQIKLKVKSFKFTKDAFLKNVELVKKVKDLTRKEIENIYKKSKLDIKKFFNTSGKVYKELDLKNKLLNMNESEKLELLASNGMLLKRPLLVEGNKVIVGFNEKEYEEKLK